MLLIAALVLAQLIAVGAQDQACAQATPLNLGGKVNAFPQGAAATPPFYPPCAGTNSGPNGPATTFVVQGNGCGMSLMVCGASVAVYQPTTPSNNLADVCAQPSAQSVVCGTGGSMCLNVNWLSTNNSLNLIVVYATTDSPSIYLENAGCPFSMCPAVSAPTNGFISGPSNQAAPAILFSCQTGYQLPPASESSAMCQPNGQWSAPIPPACEILTCEPIPESPDQSVSCKGYRDNDTCTLTCNQGYQSYKNSVTTTCRNGQWDSKLQCTPLPRLSSEQKKDDVGTDAWVTGGIVVFILMLVMVVMFFAWRRYVRRGGNMGTIATRGSRGRRSRLEDDDVEIELGSSFKQNVDADDDDVSIDGFKAEPDSPRMTKSTVPPPGGSGRLRAPVDRVAPPAVPSPIVTPLVPAPASPAAPGGGDEITVAPERAPFAGTTTLVGKIPPPPNTRVKAGATASGTGADSEGVEKGKHKAKGKAKKNKKKKDRVRRSESSSSSPSSVSPSLMDEAKQRVAPLLEKGRKKKKEMQGKL